MKSERLLLLCLFIVLIGNSIATKERDYKTHSELQEIKTLVKTLEKMNEEMIELRKENQELEDLLKK